PKELSSARRALLPLRFPEPPSTGEFPPGPSARLDAALRPALVFDVLANSAIQRRCQIVLRKVPLAAAARSRLLPEQPQASWWEFLPTQPRARSATRIGGRVATQELATPPAPRTAGYVRAFLAASR